LSPIAQIRASLSIEAAWRLLGLPGAPRKECRSPFRFDDDRHGSFSIYSAEGWQRWFDHGRAQGGDVVDFWAIAKGISVPEAVKDILGQHPVASGSLAALARPPEARQPPEGILWPENLAEPTEAECRALGALRGLSPQAFWLAGRLGTLVMGFKRGQRIWMTTDAAMRSAAMRRLDGKNLDLINAKSAAPRGSRRDWPVGLRTKNPAYDALENILAVEGEGDYYAALALAIESPVSFRAAAILGSSVRAFAEEARPFVDQKKILIIGHNDPAGQRAIPEWVKEFYRLGVKSVKTQGLPFIHDDLTDFLHSPGLNQPLNLLEGFSPDVDNSPAPKP